MKNDEMSAAELRAAIGQLWPGRGGQTRAAEAFGVNARRIRAWVAGENPVPPWLSAAVREMLILFPEGEHITDPRPLLDHVFKKMAGGPTYSPGMAAAAILAAALTLAKRHISTKDLQRMIEESWQKS